LGIIGHSTSRPWPPFNLSYTFIHPYEATLIMFIHILIKPHSYISAEANNLISWKDPWWRINALKKER